MRIYNFYFVKSKTSYAASVRINKRVWTLRFDKGAHRWKCKFLHYKLEDLDILGLYYEVGFLKY